MEPIKSIDYSVFFENRLQALQEFISKGNYSKVFFLVDTNTEEHCLPLVEQFLDIKEYDIIVVDPGEENKNIDFCIGIWKNLLDFGADRDSLLINIGGGVITDMGGFAAATYKRGIDFVQVPTTLLSQVDASVGGKTGIDMDHVKNIIGTFTQPKAVFIETEFLKTLDARQLLSGFAEVIKHGLIYDVNLFNQVKNIQAEEVTPEIIYRSIQIKNEVVTQDPFEKGLRKILNFGHTIGHAIESYSLSHDENPLLHGEAIAIGYICEGYLSQKLNGLSKTDLNEICNTIKRLYPKYMLNPENYAAYIDYMKNDKKNNSGRINCSLLKAIGMCSINSYCSEKDLIESLDFYNGVFSTTAS